MKIIVDDNFMDKNNKAFVEDIVLGHNFPFFHKTKILHDSTDYNGFFEHIILGVGDDKWNSQHHPFFESILHSFTEKHKMKYELLFRASVNLTYNNGVHDKCPIHVDHTFPHKQLLVYLNDPQDKDSKTIILNEKKDTVLKEVVPKQFRGVMFDSLPHYHIMPKKGERIVFVITFK